MSEQQPKIDKATGPNMRHVEKKIHSTGTPHTPRVPIKVQPQPPKKNK